MLEASIIEPVEKSEWINPMVIQENKQGRIRICVDLRKLNYASYMTLSLPRLQMRS
jgi:hypothetical protein